MNSNNSPNYFEVRLFDKFHFVIGYINGCEKRSFNKTKVLRIDLIFFHIDFDF